MSGDKKKAELYFAIPTKKFLTIKCLSVGRNFSLGLLPKRCFYSLGGKLGPLSANEISAVATGTSRKMVRAPANLSEACAEKKR